MFRAGGLFRVLKRANSSIVIVFGLAPSTVRYARNETAPGVPSRRAIQSRTRPLYSVQFRVWSVGRGTVILKHNSPLTKS